MIEQGLGNQGRDYKITTISKEDYCNSSDIIFIVYIELGGYDDKIELRLNGLKEEKEVEDFVNGWDNPLRLRNSFLFSKNIIITPIKKDIQTYSTECVWNGVHIIAKCINKDTLLSFIDYLNNPEIPSMDVLIKEHIRLSGLIDNYIQDIFELKNQRKLIEYRMWAYEYNKSNDEG